MSVQFGRCNFDGKPVNPQEIEQVRPIMARYGPDGEGYICKDNFALLYRAFYTTKDSRREVQPLVMASETVLVWDGRLDNREELINELKRENCGSYTDLEIVAAAYKCWGTDAFAELIGDWALSIWSPNDQSLVLAKDFVGSRQLYYSVVNGQVTWSSVLDPFIVKASHLLELDREYVAGWLGFLPAPYLTPYVGIHSVPPSCFVHLSKEAQTCTRYWDFDPAIQVRYRTDAEYEEHFRSVFADAVRHRLRSDSAILAELSGGVDSSSIVCMADTLIARDGVETPRIDTVSLYDDSEPNWNELPYIAKVHEQRGRAGNTINVSSREYLSLECSRLEASPAAIAHDKLSEQFETCILSHRARIVLSGVGGDEMLGGVPTPVPELADFLAAGRLSDLVHGLKIWALNTRRPWLHILLEVAKEFLPRSLVKRAKHERPACWLTHSFAKRYQEALSGYASRIRFLGPAPSFQEALLSIESLRRQIAAMPLSSTPFEKRYPFLDRALMEFLVAIPRNQLVRPGERRSLMRRALRGIVPEEVLNRRRKGYVVRAPLLSIRRHSHALQDLANGMVCAEMNIVDVPRYRIALQQPNLSVEFPIVQFIRTVNLETWLRSMTRSGHVLIPTIHVSPHLGLDITARANAQQQRHLTNDDAIIGVGP